MDNEIAYTEKRGRTLDFLVETNPDFVFPLAPSSIEKSSATPPSAFSIFSSEWNESNFIVTASIPARSETRTKYKKRVGIRGVEKGGEEKERNMVEYETRVLCEGFMCNRNG